MKPSKPTPAILSILLSSALLAIFYPQDTAATQADAISPTASQGPAQWQLNTQAPLIRTELAAFLIQGKRKSDSIFVPDMDILITKDNKRLIPLLRFLRLIEASGELRNDMVIFKVEGGKLTPLDILNKTLQVNDQKVPIDIQVGVSDVTNSAEIYVSEEILKQAFGFDFVWDPEQVAYTITTDRELEIFKRRRLQIAPISTTGLTQIEETLPETEGPARPELKKPLVSFIQTDSRTTARRQWSQRSKFNDISEAPAVNIWGNLGNGAYKATLRNYLRYPDIKLPDLFGWVDSLIWTAKNDTAVFNIGNINMGLSDLVAPAVNMVGAAFKWLPRAKDRKNLRDRFFKSNRPLFLSEEMFDGYAPAGSEVDLWINNRLIDSRIAEESAGAPPGYGYYNFGSINLMSDSINDVKFSIKRPDGTIEEFHKEILAVNQLLPARQLACIGGVGTKKMTVMDKTNFNGAFAGTQVLYGLTKDLTIGLTTAVQDKFAVFRDELTYEYREAPMTYYAALEARARLLNRLIAKCSIGVSYDPLNNSQAYASTADLDYYLGSARLKAKVFSFDPEYSNGVVSMADRQGYALSGTWKIFKYLFVTGGAMHIYDNLKGTGENTRSEDLLSGSAVISGLVPGWKLELQAGHLKRLDEFGEAVEGTRYGAELTGAFMKKFDFSLYYAISDKEDLTQSNELTSGISIPNFSPFYSYTARASVNCRLTPSHTLSSSYYKSYYQDRVEVSHTYTSTGKHRWSSRFNIGEVLNTSKRYFNGNVEVELDKRGDNRIGARVGFDETGARYDAGLYVTLRNMFGFLENRFKNIADMAVVPERGGVFGKVYLDLNCNGHREAGEPGVPNISIVVDGVETTVSDKEGDFYIARRERKDLITVSLGMDDLPAIYTPTQGRQRAYWEEGSFTSVNLGVAVLTAVSGTVKVMDKGAFVKNVSGVRVLLMDKEHGMVIKDSVTAYDGSFYIGQIRPGDYILKIDPETVPDTAEMRPADLLKITILPVGKPLELEDCEIYLDIKDPEVVKKEIEEVAKKAAALEAKAKPKQDGRLTSEVAAVDHKLLADKVRDALLYIYRSVTVPERTSHRTDAVSISLT